MHSAAVTEVSGVAETEEAQRDPQTEAATRAVEPAMAAASSEHTTDKHRKGTCHRPHGCHKSPPMGPKAAALGWPAARWHTIQHNPLAKVLQREVRNRRVELRCSRVAIPTAMQVVTVMLASARVTAAVEVKAAMALAKALATGSSRGAGSQASQGAATLLVAVAGSGDGVDATASTAMATGSGCGGDASASDAQAKAMEKAMARATDRDADV